VNTRERLHQEIEATRVAFHDLLDSIPEEALSQPSDNPAWNIRQALFHIALIPRYLIVEVTMVRRQVWLWQLLPRMISKSLFDWLNARMTRWGAHRMTRQRLAEAYDQSCQAAQRALDTVADDEFGNQLNYPLWDPLLAGDVTVEYLFGYIKRHYDSHAAQIIEKSTPNFQKEPIVKSQHQELSPLPTGTTLYRFNGVPVVAQASFWPDLILLTGLLTWLAGRRHPSLNWLQRLGVGLLAMFVALPADVGHAMAHTISAHFAGAPMDEILLSSGMPRTLYKNNNVPPQTHILRSLGGPIFSLICAMLSMLWWRLSPHGSLSHDLAEASLAGHSMILLGSIAPVPVVDGGTILKWKLVEAGQSPEQAERTVHKTSLGLGAGFLGLGVLLAIFRKRKLAGGLLAVCGAVGIAAGKGWLK